jgi:two-component system chemotaxis response regulator CheB
VTSASLAKTAHGSETGARIRVMLVDDSGVSRALMSQWLRDDSRIEVVATASNGRDAIAIAAAQPLDVIVLDVEMPGIGGLEALPKLIEAAPDARILMASTLTTRNARVTLEALQLGATDAIAKPQSGWASPAGPEFRGEFVRKVLALAEIGRARSGAGAARAQQNVPPPISRAAPSKVAPGVLAVGASTGGPNALFELFEQLPKPVRVPILVTQHMPPTFTAILAEHIGRRAGLPACEVADGTAAEPGIIYVAPGGRHLEAVRKGDRVILKLSDAPPENFCRPSVNPMFRSAASVWGAATLGVMMTGMGSDGLDGARKIVAGGGTMLAQDQASSVVWGMPGSVVKAGLAAEVLPVSGLASAIGCLLEGVS